MGLVKVQLLKYLLCENIEFIIFPIIKNSIDQLIRRYEKMQTQMGKA